MKIFGINPNSFVLNIEKDFTASDGKKHIRRMIYNSTDNDIFIESDDGSKIMIKDILKCLMFNNNDMMIKDSKDDIIEKLNNIIEYNYNQIDERDKLINDLIKENFMLQNEYDDFDKYMKDVFYTEKRKFRID